MQSTSGEMPGWMKHKLESRFLGEISITSDMQMPPLWQKAESKEELENLLMKVKEENERAGLKLNMQKTMIMASSSITSWQIDGKTMETVRDFILGGLQNHCSGDCSHEIKGHLFLGRKAMTNLDNILRNRDIILLTKVHLVKAMVLLIIMYGCENWMVKKAEHQELMLLNCGIGKYS